MKNNTTYIPNWYSPNPSSFWFDNVADLLVTESNVELTLIEFTLPVASNGIMKWFGQEVCPNSEWGNVTWRILINDAPDRIYGSIVGEISSIKEPTEIYMFLNKGTQVKLVVEYTKAIETTVKVAGRLKGWHWIEDGDNDY